MRSFVFSNIATAHEKIVKHIVANGYPILTEDKEETIECEPISITIKKPMAEPRISGHSPFREAYMEKYSDSLINGYESSDFSYDYHTRLYSYQGCQRIQKDYDMQMYDQVALMETQLARNKTTRRAQAITWNPAVDPFMKDCPCLQLIQCVIRDDHLNMNVVFRSNDMLMAFGANAYALTKMQESILTSVDAIRLNKYYLKPLNMGSYTHIALIPHVYPKRDAVELKKFVESN